MKLIFFTFPSTLFCLLGKLDLERLHLQLHQFQIADFNNLQKHKLSLLICFNNISFLKKCISRLLDYNQPEDFDFNGGN